ncbi:Hydroxyethylthiazole kinase [Eremomyces bilateralis CBS 781.70]|uniref:Hydroxyethylthiazole kinase n=1 Tax=Eremomyces bilateralis CBS 781.70 TaxID=1392243 RepID=A0A6G1FZU5_9PEZI|nr:Hydroxyethylthiazole kinase [Eremomyces bilateralis CBS 781.70]KAF1811298.1 Hydroxyethylthiazole kinase [Eremomyces bilateralis CBS 781.70]
MMKKSEVNYELYLVTDSTEKILGSRDLVEIVRKAVEGGVTIVQYRDKDSDAAVQVANAKKLLKVTQAHGIPLLINDRIDVALAAGADGVHIGQDDIDLPTARKMLGDDAIIGVTACSVEEALTAARQGADYVGVGTVYATPTKENAKSIIGVAGTREVLRALHQENREVKAVCIGGINLSNVERVNFQLSVLDSTRLDGVAVVSAIIAAADPKVAAKQFRHSLAHPPPFIGALTQTNILDALSQQTPFLSVIERVATQNPLCHNMTNTVVQNFAANVAIAIGGSPIMSTQAAEAVDLARLGGSLVVNMGTVTPESIAAYITAAQAYNAVGGPVVFDPVGAGATGLRRATVKKLMNEAYFDLIKGNEGEITTVYGVTDVQQRGVDSGVSTSTLEEKARLVRDLALREGCVVLMTGKTDVISDGRRTFTIENGHEFLGSITGSGCTLGTTIAACLAVAKEDKLLAAMAGVLFFEIAAEVAAAKPGVVGPGTFGIAFLDSLYALRNVAVQRSKDGVFLARAKVNVVNFD